MTDLKHLSGPQLDALMQHDNPVVAEAIKAKVAADVFTILFARDEKRGGLHEDVITALFHSTECRGRVSGAMAVHNAMVKTAEGVK
jgi:hypothetical protein